MGMCSKCSKISGKLFLLFGVVFLLRDFNVWNFWSITAWSVLFVLIGIISWAKSCCVDCQACNGMTVSSKKKK